MEKNNNKWISESDLMSCPEAADQEIQQAMNRCVEKVAAMLESFSDAFPGPASEQLFYVPGPNRSWTSGFWTGEVWLAYENAAGPEQKNIFLTAGLKQISTFLDRIRRHEDVDHHDMGFLYTPSCVAGYKLTGSLAGREAAVLAADQLLTRFQPTGGFLQAWGAMGAPDNYRFIIDCLLNLPLLYWASEETGDSRYRKIAGKHLETAMTWVIREDGSTWHTVFMNPVTGAFDHGATCQGYRDGSAWARGQAWGIYGTAMAYRYTKNPEYLMGFRRVTDYFLRHLPGDLCPYWDLTFGEGDGETEPRDSSSAAIAACGLLEMGRHLKGDEAEKCVIVARKILKALIDGYQSVDITRCGGVLLHGTYSKKSPYNTCTQEGVDECVIWGDYFFMEALQRLLVPDWQIYW